MISRRVLADKIDQKQEAAENDSYTWHNADTFFAGWDLEPVQ